MMDQLGGPRATRGWHQPQRINSMRSRHILFPAITIKFTTSWQGWRCPISSSVPRGSLIRLSQAKTDPDGTGRASWSPCRADRFIVRWQRCAWLAASHLAEGLFRSVTKGGRLRSAALAAQSIGEIVKAYAAQAGLDQTAFGGHSLRSGCLTSATERRASLWKLRGLSAAVDSDLPGVCAGAGRVQ
jgi:hypothetical protein